MMVAVCATGAATYSAVNIYNGAVDFVYTKNYLTEDDLAEFKASDRNLFESPGGLKFSSKEFITTLQQLHTKAIEVRKVREPKLTEEDRKAHYNVSRKEINESLRMLLFGSKAEKLRFLNDFYSFYCTNKEVQEMLRKRAEGEEWETKAK